MDRRINQPPTMHLTYRLANAASVVSTKRYLEKKKTLTVLPNNLKRIITVIYTY